MIPFGSHFTYQDTEAERLRALTTVPIQWTVETKSTQLELTLWIALWFCLPHTPTGPRPGREQTFPSVCWPESLCRQCLCKLFIHVFWTNFGIYNGPEKALGQWEDPIGMRRTAANINATHSTYRVLPTNSAESWQCLLQKRLRSIPMPYPLSRLQKWIQSSAYDTMSAASARRAVGTSYGWQNMSEIVPIHIAQNTVTLIMLRTMKPWNDFRFMRSQNKIPQKIQYICRTHTSAYEK